MICHYPNLFFSANLKMSINLTEPTTLPSSCLGKRKALHSDLFTKKLFVQRDLPPEHEDAKTHYISSKKFQRNYNIKC